VAESVERSTVFNGSPSLKCSTKLLKSTTDFLVKLVPRVD